MLRVHHRPAGVDITTPKQRFEIHVLSDKRDEVHSGTMRARFAQLALLLPNIRELYVVLIVAEPRSEPRGAAQARGPPPAACTHTLLGLAQSTCPGV